MSKADVTEAIELIEATITNADISGLDDQDWDIIRTAAMTSMHPSSFFQTIDRLAAEAYPEPTSK